MAEELPHHSGSATLGGTGDGSQPQRRQQDHRCVDRLDRHLEHCPAREHHEGPQQQRNHNEHQADPDVGAVEVLGVGHCCGVAAGLHGTDRSIGCAAIDGCRPGGAASTDPIDDLTEVPQLQRFSHGVGDEAGGQRVDLPARADTVEGAVMARSGGLGDAEPDPAGELEEPAFAIHQPGRVGEDRDRQRRHGQRNEDHRPAPTGFAAVNGDHSGEHSDWDRDRQQAQLRGDGDDRVGDCAGDLADDGEPVGAHRHLHQPQCQRDDADEQPRLGGEDAGRGDVERHRFHGVQRPGHPAIGCPADVGAGLGDLLANGGQAQVVVAQRHAVGVFEAGPVEHHRVGRRAGRRRGDGREQCQRVQDAQHQ